MNVRHASIFHPIKHGWDKARLLSERPRNTSPTMSSQGSNNSTPLQRKEITDIRRKEVNWHYSGKRDAFCHNAEERGGKLSVCLWQHSFSAPCQKSSLSLPLWCHFWKAQRSHPSAAAAPVTPYCCLCTQHKKQMQPRLYFLRLVPHAFSLCLRCSLRFLPPSPLWLLFCLCLLNQRLWGNSMCHLITRHCVSAKRHRQLPDN